MSGEGSVCLPLNEVAAFGKPDRADSVREDDLGHEIKVGAYDVVSGAEKDQRVSRVLLISKERRAGTLGWIEDTLIGAE